MTDLERTCGCPTTVATWCYDHIAEGYRGQLRSQCRSDRRWKCDHYHTNRDDATACARQELDRRTHGSTEQAAIAVG